MADDVGLNTYLCKEFSPIFPIATRIYKNCMEKNRVFAERLRARIEADPNLTAAGLAVKAGLDNSTIRQLLSGRIETPTMRTAEKICAALGTTVEEFMSNAETEEEREIVRLVSRLPAHLRRQLLGYGQALLDAADQLPSEEDATDQSTIDRKP